MLNTVALNDIGKLLINILRIDNIRDFPRFSGVFNKKLENVSLFTYYSNSFSLVFDVFGIKLGDAKNRLCTVDSRLH